MINLWNKRLFAAAALTLAAVACSGQPDPELRAKLREMTGQPSEQTCGKCHAEVWREHSGNLHANAWVDKLYRMSVGGQKYPHGYSECRACHSMEPILYDDLSSDYGYRPVYRPYNQEDGIGCVSCHLRADGKVAARHTDAAAPCKPVEDARIHTIDYCGTCHNPSHDAIFEFYGSRAFKEGKTCHSCHMLEVDRTGADGKKKRGFSHVFPGGNDEAIVRRSARASIEVELVDPVAALLAQVPHLEGLAPSSGFEIVFKIENLTSHKLPAEIPDRYLKFWATFIDSSEIPRNLPDEVIVLRRSSKREAGWRDNRLLPDETRTLRQRIPRGVSRIRSWIYFQQSPFMQRPGWVVLAEWKGTLP